jgi:hypothetical protein
MLQGFNFCGYIEFLEIYIYIHTYIYAQYESFNERIK